MWSEFEVYQVFLHIPMINFDFAISQKWLTAKWVFVESHTRQTPFCQWSQKGSLWQPAQENIVLSPKPIHFGH
jgi:hypothetical protein